MDIEDLLDLVVETVEGSPTVPLTGKKMVDSARVLDIINDIRLSMPTEIRKAKMLVDERQQYLAAANQEAEKIVKKAEDRARILISQEEVVKRSKEEATEIMRTSQQRAKELQNNVTNYCESILKKTEEQLADGMMDVKKVRATLKKK